MKASRNDQFCHLITLPSISKDGPSGWVISSGLMSSRNVCPGTRSGSYSPITGAGVATTSDRSISSSSIVFMSTISFRPDTGLAYGLPVGLDRTQTSAQPSRRSRYFSGINALP